MSADRVREVGVFDAKTRLSYLLDQVERGDCIVITRHGRPVAQLVPYVEFDRARVRAAVQALLEFEGGSLPEGASIRQLRDEGRP
ncbi:MAG: type II toxin-antitoxin system Phd/YefM family antitoxin [Planctomycetota bacterium]|jgi:prevent-host-death family protein